MSTTADTPTAGTRRVVVGLDGSKESIRALEFATEEAKLRGATLHAVYAFPSPTAIGVNVPQEYFDDLKSTAEHELDIALSAVPQALGLPGLVRTTIPEAPALALIAASEGADLVVVGSRGRGGFQALVLGSVSMQVAEHAHCPIVIVR